MDPHPNQVIEDFDFTAALKLSADARMQSSVSLAQRQLVDRGLLGIFGIPPIPPCGATDAELDGLRLKTGVPLPHEYAAFLRLWRYLILDDGYQIWGLDHKGVSIGSPWFSDRHRTGHRYLVFGQYWRYADGDQLLFDLDDPDTPVVAYLREHGPLYERYAPSFSLALWRMADEWLRDGQDV
jgi:hypothetical protein